MAANRSAAIKSKNKTSPFKLRVQIHPRGIFWDLLEGPDTRHRPVITTSGKSARALARWILDNVEE